MILKLGIYHLGLKFFKVYINDDPGLNLTYFTARSNWFTSTFKLGKLLQSHLMDENLQRRTILNEIDPRGLSASVLGLYTCIYSLLSNIFFSKTTGLIKAEFHVEPPWDVGKKLYINGTGHMTKMAAMLIYGKNLQNLLLQNK